MNEYRNQHHPLPPALLYFCGTGADIACVLVTEYMVDTVYTVVTVYVLDTVFSKQCIRAHWVVSPRFCQGGRICAPSFWECYQML